MKKRPLAVFFSFGTRLLTTGLMLLLSAGVAGAIATGDTLTVIQRPLVNIPSIVAEGDTMTIDCEASPGTSGWAAELVYGSITVPMTVLSSTYNSSTEWWEIDVQVPVVPVYELYDLRVTASGGIDDTTWDAVRVVSAFKSDYYFVHITDTHLPTSLYYYEDGADTDSSEVEDLRAIIQDVNLINPEFVVLTGDFINEGELEEFLDKKYFSRTQALLREFKVPVYLTSGNHDIGGWDDTPPPDGNARRNWWRFFGWKRLDSPPAGAPWYTQNYSFDYGPVHYIGLEAYNNYDNWRPGIYGTDSFTSGQMQWLEDDIAAASGSAARVLFYHSDFTGQIDLDALGADMALYGHAHSDRDDWSHPYYVRTDNACDGARSYRLIRVSGGSVQPTSTISAGSNGDNLRVDYSPGNDGTHYSVSADITNSFNEEFEHSVIRFIMPNEAGTVSVTGGTLLQVDTSGPQAVYYVAADIPANSSPTVSLELTPGPSDPPEITVNQPDGAETWNMGSFCDITWTATDDVGVTSIDILLSTDGGGSYGHTIATGEIDDGTYSWLVDVAPTTLARVRVIAYDADANEGEDASDGNFTIADGEAPVVAVIQPNGGETWPVDSLFDITWTATDNIGVASVDIMLSSDGGASYPHIIATGEANDGTYSWQVDTAATTEARVKVVAYDAAANSGEDASQADFEIYDPTSGIPGDGGIPPRVVISAAVPNPFSTGTVIRFGLPRDGWVQAGVYDVSGRLVTSIAEGQYGAGYHEVAWAGDGSVEPGIYFIRLRLGSEAAARRVIKIR